MHAYSLSHVWLFVTRWTVACQTPLSMEFSRQEYCRGLCLPPREAGDNWDGWRQIRRRRDIGHNPGAGPHCSLLNHVQHPGSAWWFCWTECVSPSYLYHFGLQMLHASLAIKVFIHRETLAVMILPPRPLLHPVTPTQPSITVLTLSTG